MLKKKSSKTEPKETIWFFNDFFIGTSKSYKDYVKAKPTDTIRSKMTSLQDFSWDKEKLNEIFPNKQKEIIALTDIYRHEKKEGALSFWIDQGIKKLQD